MASTAQSVRFCLRRQYRAVPGVRPATATISGLAVADANASSTSSLQQPQQQRRRCLSTTPTRLARDSSARKSDKELQQELATQIAEARRITDISETMREMVPEAEKRKIRIPSRQNAKDEFFTLEDMRRSFARAAQDAAPTRFENVFWNDGETDPDMLNNINDEFDGNDITSMAHGKLDELRERRHYARLLAWELPLLAEVAKPFEAPSADMPLRFRYTSYMGEFHPAEKKVTVDFCPADFDLTPVQQDKLKKLVGARYNPEKEIVHMSCEMFEHQAQNKRYLGDLVQKLVAEAKDPTDTFEDVPLDTRHHTFKEKPKFPKEWRMTEERRKELQDIRAQAFLLDQQKAAEGALVDGKQRIQASLSAPAPKEEPVAELLRTR